MHERREYSRVLFRREVFVTLPDGMTLTSMAEDFSMYGMGILTEHPLDLGSELTVEFNILSQDDWREITLRGKVVYSTAKSSQFKNGISFA
jgi:hypothetical protein